MAADQQLSDRAPPGAPGEGFEIPGAGVTRNTLLQFASQIASAVFTAGLTLYLVRKLGASSYGVYALAVSLGSLVVLPAGLGLPWAIGRFLADHRRDAREVRAIFDVGMRLQVPAAAIFGIAMFACSGLIADAYGNPHLGWPLRWIALSVIGQAVFAFLTSVGQSVRRMSVGLWMSVIESVAETAAAVGFVLAGGAAAGAVLGKAVGYTVATLLGVYLMLRLLRLPGAAAPDRGRPRKLSLGTILRYAGAMFVVDLAWSAITQVDVILIAAVLSSTAVGSFGAVIRILAVVGYIPTAVAAAVAPRLSAAAGDPDVESFVKGFRYLIIVQGLIIAPMLVWAGPIVGLLLGPGYHASVAVIRTIVPYYFIAGPAALVTVTVTYLGEARRRVTVVLFTLILGLVATYILLHLIGIVGAAVADDVLYLAYLIGHLRICNRLLELDLKSLARCAVRTLLAAGVMSLTLLAFGTSRLTAPQWIGGAIAAIAAYTAMLLITHELSLGELRAVGASIRSGLRP